MITQERLENKKIIDHLHYLTLKKITAYSFILKYVEQALIKWLTYEYVPIQKHEIRGEKSW